MSFLNYKTRAWIAGASFTRNQELVAGIAKFARSKYTNTVSPTPHHIRSLKQTLQCDESRPNCGKCVDFEVWCNYDPTIPDLQSCIGSVVKVHLSPAPTPSINHTTISMLNTSLSSCIGASESHDSYHFTKHDLQLLNRFQFRTIHTLGTPQCTQTYQKELVKLAYLVSIHTVCPQIVIDM